MTVESVEAVEPVEPVKPVETIKPPVEIDNQIQAEKVEEPTPAPPSPRPVRKKRAALTPEQNAKLERLTKRNRPKI